MEVSWGLIILLVLVLFPGLIIRRLYYYGEFSKQFSSGLNLIKLLGHVLVPGIINLLLIFYLYDSIISSIDLGKVIDSIKNVINPDFKWENSPGKPIKSAIRDDVFPFLGFLYFSSILIGALSGRLVRISRIDTNFKLLRFKNYWFYLLNGEHTKFKKLRHLKQKNTKHLFTKADILIDTSEGTHLYSGIVVDYELMNNDCQSLSKLMLQNAERYSKKNDTRIRVEIPGNLLIVDCLNIRNINLTFVSEERKTFLESKVPSIIYNSFSLVFILLIAMPFFQIESLEWKVYQDYFTYPWYARIIGYLLVIQIISLANIFVKNSKTDDFEYVSITILGLKLALVAVLFLILYSII